MHATSVIFYQNVQKCSIQQYLQISYKKPYSINTLNLKIIYSDRQQTIQQKANQIQMPFNLKTIQCLMNEKSISKKFIQKTISQTKLTIQLNITNFIRKSHAFSLRQFIRVQIVIFQIDFHDKIRKIEYYKIKRMLHDQKGTDSPFEITTYSSQQNMANSSGHSSGNMQNMTKLLQSHFFNSFNNQIKDMQDQKTKINRDQDFQDTIQEINKYINDADGLDFTQIEQQSYFLIEKNETQNSKQKIEKTKLNFQKLITQQKKEVYQKKASLYEKLESLKKTYKPSDNFAKNLLDHINSKSINTARNQTSRPSYQEKHKFYKQIESNQNLPKHLNIKGITPVKNMNAKPQHSRQLTSRKINYLALFNFKYSEKKAETQRGTQKSITQKKIDISSYKSQRVQKIIHNTKKLDSKFIKIEKQEKSVLTQKSINKQVTIQKGNSLRKKSAPKSMQLSSDFIKQIKNQKFENKSLIKDKLFSQRF